MNSRNATSWIVAWLLFWGVVACAAWIGLSRSAQNRESSPDSATWNLTKKLGEVELRLNEELSLKEQDFRAKSRESAARRQQELENALGGSVQAAFKNPAYSLREALRRAALASAPGHADVRVTVDRFTEFTVTFSSDQTFSTNEMIGIARQLLPLARTYIDSLRFSVKGSVIADLDRQDIEYTDDWLKISNDRIASLLPREIPADTTQDRASIERLKQEREFSNALEGDPALLPKLQQAQRDFLDAIKKSYEDLNAALSLCDKAISLAGVQKARDLDLRLKDLRDAAMRAKAAKEFWAGPKKIWTNLLAAQSIPAESIEKLQTAYNTILRYDAAQTAKVFEAIDHRIESTKYFLNTAAEQFGQWQFNSEFGQFAFSAEEISRRFNRARDQAIADAQALEAALRVWNESMTP